MKTFVRVVVGLTLLIEATSAAAALPEKNFTSMCDDGCFCDDIGQFLIDCKEDHLTEIYDPTEWNITLTNTTKFNLTDKELDVRFNDNKLTSIPAFPALKIVNLSFRNNRINRIEDHAFAELSSLLSLDLSYNVFTSQDLPENVFMGKYSNESYQPIPLQHLNLSHNNIHSIEKDLFDHLPALTSLDLSYNPIRILGGSTSMAIATLRKLQYLDLSYTQLTKIPEGMIHDLVFLTSLTLSGNEFKEVPQEVRHGASLTVLVLDNNRFESLDKESFKGLTSLTTLSISYMPELRIIEENTFTPLKNLFILSCQFNPKLDKISNAAFYEIYKKSDNVSEWPLKELSLNDNALTHIDQAMAQWESIQFIDIRNNPFRCDCNLEWMTETLVHQIAQTHPELSKNIICATPPVHKGNSLLDLSILPEVFANCATDPEEFMDDLSSVPGDNYQTAGVTVLTIGIVLLVVCLAVLGVIIVKRRAIASALVAHQEIRYQRADADDMDGYRGATSHHIYKVSE